MVGMDVGQNIVHITADEPLNQAASGFGGISLPCHWTPITQATCARERPSEAVEMVACNVPIAVPASVMRTIQLSHSSAGSPTRRPAAGTDRGARPATPARRR